MSRAGLMGFVLFCAASSAAEEPVRSEGWVVLSVEEYRALRAKAYPPEREPDPPPVDATLTRVDYELRVAGESAAGEARLTVDVLKDGWARVVIPAGLLVREARLDGRPVTVVEDRGRKDLGSRSVFLSRPGRAVLTMDVVVPVSTSAGTESIALPASPSALSRTALILPRQGVDVAVSGGFLAEKTESGGESRFVAHGRAGESLSFSWRRKREDLRAGLPLRLRGRVTEWVGLGEEAAQVSANVRLEVVQGQASSVTLALPEGFMVNQVSGALVADWVARADSLDVTFLEPIEQEAALVVTGEIRAPRDGAVTVPLLRLSRAERETGGVAVEVLGAGEITDQQARALDAADPTDLGEMVAGRESPSLVAFRFRPQGGAAPRSLSVTVSRYTPQAVLVANVEEARYLALLSEEGKTLVQARFAVRNSQRSFLAVTLPSNATLWSAAISGRPVRPGRSAEGALLLPLEKGRAGGEAPAFPVEIVYLDRGDPWVREGRSRLTLPALDLPISRSGLVIHHSPRFRLLPEAGPFRLQPYEAPFSEALARPTPEPPRLAYEAQRGRESGAAVAGVEGGVADGKREKAEEDKAASELQGLLERFQKEGRANRVAGVLPVQVPVPEFGPSVFLTSELTAETRAPVLDLIYKRAGDKWNGGGAR